MRRQASGKEVGAATEEEEDEGKADEDEKEEDEVDEENEKDEGEVAAAGEPNSSSTSPIKLRLSLRLSRRPPHRVLRLHPRLRARLTRKERTGRTAVKLSRGKCGGQ